METTKDMNNRKIYKKKENHDNVIINILCFLSGLVLAFIIAIAIF